MYTFAATISNKQYGILSLVNSNIKQSNVDVQIIGDNIKVIVMYSPKFRITTNFKLLYKDLTKCQPIDLCAKFNVDAFQISIDDVVESQQGDMTGHLADTILLEISENQMVFKLQDPKFIYNEGSTYKYCNFVEQ